MLRFYQAFSVELLIAVFLGWRWSSCTSSGPFEKGERRASAGTPGR